MYRNNKKDLVYGFKKGLPIAFGYIPVAFTFGLMAVTGGLPVWLAIFISVSNLTSAGQFAGTSLIIAGAGYFEITLTTFIINIRYMLMSLSLSQKIDEKIPLSQRLIFAFGITDETFTVASMEMGYKSQGYLSQEYQSQGLSSQGLVSKGWSSQGKLPSAYMFGLISGPILGWTFGTAMGALICANLPQSLASAMGIALYGMFIAIIVPPAKKSRSILIIVLISIFIMCLLKYLPLFHMISSGFRIILSTVLGAGIGAVLFPIEDTIENENNDEVSNEEVSNG